MHYPTQIVYTLVPGDKVTDAQLSSCAALFSQNYGIWSSLVSSPLKPGSRVQMSAKKLKAQCLGNPTLSVLALCLADDILVGHAFATIWRYNGSNICWITQLVVSSEWRRRGIATGLLQLFPGPDFNCYAIGLASSHPAACLALFKRAQVSMRQCDLSFVKANAGQILDTTFVEYLKTARPRGSLFQVDAAKGVISTLFTEFYVDHGEPLAALKEWKDIHELDWPLGELPEGHEFLCILPVQKW